MQRYYITNTGYDGCEDFREKCGGHLKGNRKKLDFIPHATRDNKKQKERKRFFSIFDKTYQRRYS
jgi:hypothetical protein